MLDIVIFWNLRKLTVEKSLRSVKIKRTSYQVTTWLVDY